MPTIHVLVVDDHALVRLGLITLINDQPDMMVVSEAGSATKALLEVERHRPEVVLMDIRMPGEGGLEATRRIARRFPESRVVILTSFADDELVLRAIRAGAVGYVLKDADTDELLRAVRAAARDEALLDTATTARLLGQVRQLQRQTEENAFRDLTGREFEVLTELTRGKTNAEIAEVLSLSEKTVRNHVSSILDKLQLSNRVELATYAVENHIFDKLGEE